MWLKPISEIETLNCMYKNLPPKSARKLENFNGERRISIYRCKGFLNKITQKLDSNLTLIRTLKNGGTKDKPNLVTGGLVLRAPKGDLFVHIDSWGESQKGIHVEIDRYDGDFITFQQKYDSFMHMRPDNYFMYVLERITGKQLL